MTFIKVNIDALKSPFVQVVKAMVKTKTGMVAIAAALIAVVIALVLHGKEDVNEEGFIDGNAPLRGAAEAVQNMFEMASKVLVAICLAVLILAMIIEIPKDIVILCAGTLAGKLAWDIIGGVLSGMFTTVKDSISGMMDTEEGLANA